LDGEATGVPEQPSETIEILDVDDADAVVAAAAEDPEIEKAVDSIAPVEGGPPVGTEIELPKPENYIPDRMFEEAGGAPSNPSKETREKTLDEIRKVHGLRFKDPERLADSVVTSFRCVLLDGIPIADDEALKNALLIILPAINPHKFTLDESMRATPTKTLYGIYRREMRNRGKKDLVDRLESGSAGRASPQPLTPPSTKK